MAYSTFAQVKALVDTDMEDAEVTEVIARIDEYINLKVDAGSVNALILEDLSATWSAYRVMLKDPSARSLGEASENRGKALEQLWNQVKMALSTATGGIGAVIQQDLLS